MFGTDFPFDMNATSPVAEIEAQQSLTAEQRQRIYSGTAAEFLRRRFAKRHLNKAQSPALRKGDCAMSPVD
jgi:hypothetical protein